jgi:hypothetical protein
MTGCYKAARFYYPGMWVLSFFFSYKSSAKV